MKKVAHLDHRYIWHPFTQMQDWLQRDPIVITRGKGAVLWDANGKKYFDANSSIWTNLHGHRHPAIDKAITRQLKRIAHSSALGLASEPAPLLAEKLVRAGNSITPTPGQPQLAKVFYSDDGSTAMEVALKLSHEFWRRHGIARPRFLSLERAYHGDTVGAASLGHIDLFHKAYRHLLFETDSVMAPYCYRCPFNRAKPERADARSYRQCQWECVDQVERKFSSANKRGTRLTAMVLEPLMQGAAGMIPQPDGWLGRVAQIARAYRAHLIADEVMTAFGRTTVPTAKEPRLVACHQEGVVPDFIALAKGLTGGYMPLAATLMTQQIFDAFLGKYEEFKTFFHGHSFTANPLGCSAANANLNLLGHRASMTARTRLAGVMADALNELWTLSHVGDIRQVGLVAGIELVRHWPSREPYDLRERAGIRVCDAMARRGVLTRPIGNVIVLMPPYCTTERQFRQCLAILMDATQEILGR